jgi:O-antigen/teichoic acid export membrane protein
MTTKKSLFWSFLSEYSSFCVSFVTSLVMARLLSPREFGIFAIALTLIELLVLIRQFGIGRYIVQTKELNEERLRTALGIMILLCWSFALIIVLGAGAAARLYGHAVLKPVMQIIAIGFLLVPFSQPGVALLERNLKFRSTMLINLTANTVNGITAIGCALMGFKSISLAIAVVAMQIALLVAVLIARPPGQVFIPRLSKWREVLDFGGYTIASNLVAYLGTSAPTAVLGKIADITSVGMYSRALGLVTMLKQLLQAAIAKALYAQMSKLENEGTSLSWTYTRALGFGTALTWSAASVLCFTATPVITFLYGAQWHAAGPLLGNLAIAMGIQATAPLYIEVLFIKNRQMSLLKRELLINGFALANFSYWAFHSVHAATLGRTLDALLLAVIYLPLLIKLTGADRQDVLKVLLQGLAVAIISAVPAIAVMSYYQWPESLPVMVLISLGAASLLTWILALFIVRHPLAGDMRSIIAAVQQARQR